ncbi:hypothetical protein M2139_001737 [Enterococcus sp. PF1-24]|uniref:ECF transporter S component n=1 Tax=unclassified Enterococcus TaxID=2608891 RepID=UPI0024758FE7|nr:MULTISPECIES: ECF transporter S component [unclassified Enterococcus]MDH6364687.1 hypothetical protein [Enterococcus sp. PFB1-1]MDH6401837.1 hypothetical protein [Enterococcus sp. PF1-24]
MNRKALWITQTALMLALLVATQAVTSGFGNTFITGSLVNLILIVSVCISGLTSGLTVALLSPIFAFFFGIGPQMWQIIICIALGNASLSLVWYLIAGKTKENNVVNTVIAAIVAAVVKFGVLYLSIVKFMIPVVLTKLPAPQAAKMSAMFSTPQLITALIGGALAVVVLPIVKSALPKPKE